MSKSTEDLAKELAEYTRLAEEMAIKQRVLQAELLKRMQNNGTEALKLKGNIEMVVQKQKGKKAGRSADSKEIAELKHELEAERGEMADVNAELIYKIEGQIFKLENERNLLLRNEHIDRLEQALAEAKQNKAEAEPIYTLKIKKPKDDFVKNHELRKAFIYEGRTEVLEACGKALTPAQIDAFLIEYRYKNEALGNIDIEAEWEARKAGHILYWKQND